MTLNELALKYGTDKSSDGHGYTLEAYERYLAPYRDRPIVFWEIGVLTGASILMWREFLPNARVAGLDNDPGCLRRSLGDVYIGDQSDPTFLASVIAATGAPDVVVDDGGHNGLKQIACFRQLFPRTNPGGMYVVEDTHTFYEHAHGTPSRTFGFFTGLAADVDLRGRGQTGNYERAFESNSTVQMPTFSPFLKAMHIHQSIRFYERR